MATSRKPEKFEIDDMEKFLKEYEIHKLHDHVIDRSFYIIIAAIGLIAALAWDDALHSLFIHWFGNTESLAMKMIYAFSITVIAALVSIILGRRFRGRKKKKQ